MKDIYINNSAIDFSSPLVMGILNLTPDSFYDGGSYLDSTDIKDRIQKIIDEKADILDLGAYSSRPGAEHISAQEELDRLTPAIKIIREFFPHILISIDTFRASVVEEVYKLHGEFIVNDISGGTMDENMYKTVARLNLPYIMMHIKGTPQSMQANPVYNNVVEDVFSFFEEHVSELSKLGHQKIILDPGFGFGKTLEHNYDILRNMNKYKAFNFPILVGISRKSMICKLLKCKPPKALTGTVALNTLSLQMGANILRVHDVKDAVETVKIFNAFKHGIIE